MSEMGVLEWIQGISSPGMDTAMLCVTYSATSAVLWLVLAFLLTCSRRYRKMGVAVIVSVLVAYVVVDVVMKPLIDRPRPFEFADVALLVDAPTTSSFPSGHTASSFAAATAILVYDRRAGAVAVLYAALVGFSRLYLFVHWPTDVLAGAAVGIAVALLAIRFMDRWVPYFRDLPDPRTHPGSSGSDRDRSQTD